MSVELSGGKTNCTPPFGCSKENSIRNFSGFSSEQEKDVLNCEFEGTGHHSTYPTVLVYHTRLLVF